MTKTVRYLTKDDVQRLNDHSIKRQFNRTLEPAAVAGLREARFPVQEWPAFIVPMGQKRLSLTFSANQEDWVFLDVDAGLYEQAVMEMVI